MAESGGRSKGGVGGAGGWRMAGLGHLGGAASEQHVGLWSGMGRMGGGV